MILIKSYVPIFVHCILEEVLKCQVCLFIWLEEKWQHCFLQMSLQYVYLLFVLYHGCDAV